MKKSLESKTVKIVAIILAVIIAILSFAVAGAEDDPVIPQCDDPYTETDH